MSHPSPARPPAWVGIGAQRSGTSWFTRLLLTHPEVCLSPGRGNKLVGRKELHFFDQLDPELQPAESIARYHANFARCQGSCPGEFTPSYMRLPWTAQRLQQAAPDALLICVLRDPIDRFHSGLRWSRMVAGKNGNPKPKQAAWSRLAGSEAIWGGMYATQLRVWRNLFDRILVIQFEALVQDPATAIRTTWEALGLDPVPLPVKIPEPELATDRSDLIGRSTHLDEALREIFLPEMKALAELNHIDPDLWTSMNRSRK